MRRHAAIVAQLIAMVFPSAGCAAGAIAPLPEGNSSSSTGNPPGTVSNPPIGPITEGGSPDGGACNTTNPEGPMVKMTCPSNKAPEALGGAIPDGVYALQSWDVYGLPCRSDPPVQDTRVISGSHWEHARYNVDEWFRDTDEANVGGTTVILTVQCTSVAESTLQRYEYTSSNGQLTLILRGSTAAMVFTYSTQSDEAGTPGSAAGDDGGQGG
jgi:hypothetical protein